MEPPNTSKSEHPTTYFMADRANEQELLRLIAQDQILTAGIGGVLPEFPDTTAFRCILDVGCGTGGWLFQAAQTYPTMTRLVGVDLNPKMIKYAREQVIAQQLSGRLDFYIMDALRMLEFPDTTFDLVNMRQGGSFLRTWDWPQILQEFLRVTHHKGTLRIVETDLVSESTSPAFNQLSMLLVRAFHLSGHYFTAEQNGLINQLPRMLRQAGLNDVQTQRYDAEYRADTPEGQLFIEDMRYVLENMQPFVQKWVRVPQYEALRQQAMEELHQPGFSAHWGVVTAWGKKIMR